MAEDSIEPGFPHAGPFELDGETSHAWPAVAHLNLTVGPSFRALLCCDAKRPYLGVCLTDTHIKAVYKYLESAVFNNMQTGGHALDQPGLVALAQSADSDDENSEGDGIG